MNKRYRPLVMVAIFVLVTTMSSCTFLQLRRVVNTYEHGAVAVSRINVNSGEITALANYKGKKTNGFKIDIHNKEAYVEHVYYDDGMLTYISPYKQDPKKGFFVYICRVDPERVIQSIVRTKMVCIYEDWNHRSYKMKSQEVLSPEKCENVGLYLGKSRLYLKPSNNAINADK